MKKAHYEEYYFDADMCETCFDKALQESEDK